MQFAKFNKQEAIKIGFAAGLQGDPDIVQRSYDLFSPGYAADLSVAWDGIQIMLDDDIRTGLVDKKFTLDRVINDRILKQAQQELRNEGRLKYLGEVKTRPQELFCVPLRSLRRILDLEGVISHDPRNHRWNPLYRGHGRKASQRNLRPQ